MVAETINSLFGDFLHYYSIALSFIFGAFIQEWISGRILTKERKGVKFVWDKQTYLKKPLAITVRMLEVVVMALISIPLSILLLFLLEQSKYYIFPITVIIFNTIYLATVIELPYKVKFKWACCRTASYPGAYTLFWNE